MAYGPFAKFLLKGRFTDCELGLVVWAVTMLRVVCALKNTPGTFLIGSVHSFNAVPLMYGC